MTSDLPDLIREALADLCIRARVLHDDRSPWAAERVVRALQAAGCAVAARDAVSPDACSMTTWLRRACGLPAVVGECPDEPLLLMGVSAAILLSPVVNGRRHAELVPLPACVVAAVEMLAKLRCRALTLYPITEAA